MTKKIPKQSKYKESMTEDNMAIDIQIIKNPTITILIFWMTTISQIVPPRAGSKQIEHINPNFIMNPEKEAEEK